MSSKGKNTPRELWVFGYGSLMWRPGFAFEDVVHARLVGWKRCFCIYSVVYRGTPERPGLVLGLDRGGACEGMAFRVRGEKAAEVLAYLRNRELVTGVYREALVPVELMSGERPIVDAVAYIAERAHPSYAGQRSLADQAWLIADGFGISGSNIEYLRNTLLELRRFGIREREMERILGVAGRGGRWLRLPRNRPSASVVVVDASTNGGAGGCSRKRCKQLRPGEGSRFIHRKVMGAVR